MSASQQEQHDDHCWLVFMGQQWKIIGIERRGFWLRTARGDYTFMETEHVDWDGYRKAAISRLAVFGLEWCECEGQQVSKGTCGNCEEW